MRDDLESLYDLYAPMVFRRCRQLLGDPDDARDVCHEVFIRLLEHRGEVHDPPAFLWRMATNTSLNFIRSHNRYQARLQDPRLVEIARFEEHPVQNLLARSSLARLFGSTSPSTRHIAVLHFIDGLTLEQVADSVGLSVSGVRKRLRKLRQHLENLEGARP